LSKFPPELHDVPRKEEEEKKQPKRGYRKALQHHKVVIRHRVIEAAIWLAVSKALIVGLIALIDFSLIVGVLDVVRHDEDDEDEVEKDEDEQSEVE